MKKDANYQGFFLAFHLTPEFLKLEFCRLIPLGRVPLRDIKSMRVSSLGEMLPRRWKHLHHLWLNDYWPALVVGYKKRMSALYLIETHRGRRVFARLKSRLHYNLRLAIGANQEQRHDESAIDG